MPEIETQNGTVEVEEGDTINIAYREKRPDRHVELEDATVEGFQGADFMGYSVLLAGTDWAAHPGEIESLEVVN